MSDSKPFYSIIDLNPSLLRALEPVFGTPSLADVVASLERVQMDHKLGWTGRLMHPAQKLPDYGSDIASRNGAGALRVMLNDPVEDKTQALISYVQMGIHWYGILLAGGSWTGDGGHAEGRRLPIAFAGVLLDNQEIKDAVSNANRDTFGENGGIEYCENAGIPQFAQVECSGEVYWRKLADPVATGSTLLLLLLGLFLVRMKTKI